MKRFLDKYHSLGWSALGGFVLFWVFYFLSNLPISFSAESNTLSGYHWTLQTLGVKPKIDIGDWVFINNCYDRELIDFNDADGLPIGNIDITDRDKLCEFLEIAGRQPDYKFIVIDVFFEKGLESESDERLWHLLTTTPRVIVPKHHGRIPINATIDSIASYSDYNTTIESTDFVKYPIVNGSNPSLAWCAASAVEANKYQHLLGVYTSEGHLMRRSMMPSLDIPPLDFVNGDTLVLINNLGSDILALPEEIPAFIRDKYVMIGDYADQDIHNTYLGKMSGPLINANVINNIIECRHLIPWWHAFLIWILLSFIIWCTINKNIILPRFKIAEWFKQKGSQGWITVGYLCNLLISLVSYSVIFAAIMLLFYATTGFVYEFMLLSIIFVGLSKIFSK